MTPHDAQMLKGLLTPLILALAAQQEDYGYSLVVRLRDGGFEGLSEGSVYPALTRLEQQGLLSSRLVPSTAGPARKYYAVTPAGASELTRTASQWHDLVRSAAAILPPPPSNQEPS